MDPPSRIHGGAGIALGNQGAVAPRIIDTKCTHGCIAPLAQEETRNEDADALARRRALHQAATRAYGARGKRRRPLSRLWRKPNAAQATVAPAPRRRKPLSHAWRGPYAAQAPVALITLDHGGTMLPHMLTARDESGAVAPMARTRCGLGRSAERDIKAALCRHIRSQRETKAAKAAGALVA
eukprot:gene16062-biopygen11436